MRFRLRKDSVSDLVKNFGKISSKENAKEVITEDFFGVSVLAACTVTHKVSRVIAKQKGLFLSFL